MNNILNRISLFRFAIIILLIYGVFYVGNALSPSSYGILLNQIGAESEGLFFGNPQKIRSDEWAVYTPLLQAAVKNNFERYNKTSAYQEDLRPILSLPIKDWSIPFKPALLGFYFLPPAYAFSLYYFITMALFLSGFAMMFRTFGLSEVNSIAFALLVYFSGFSQNWWSVIGLMAAFFSWSYVILVSRKNFYLRLLLFYFFISWMIFSMFYPVFFYGFAVIMAVLLYCFNRDFFNIKNVISFGICAIFALLTYLFYIKDSLLPLANTIYPSQRMAISGGEVSLMQWLSQFFPSLVISEIMAVDFSGKSNVCEMSVIGSYLFLFGAIFGNWRNYMQKINREELKSIAILFGAFVFFSCWMLLPIPSIFVKIIFLDRIPGVRCFFISGIFLLSIAAIILPKLEFEITKKRSALAITSICAISIFSIICYNVPEISLPESMITLCLLISLLIFHYFIINLKAANLKLALLTIVVVNNVIIFGQFNPLQSAKPIFDLPQTDFLKELNNKENFNKNGFFIEKNLLGATANGMGLKSISHVLCTPQLEIFRCYFPEIEEVEFNNIFNRYLHVRLDDIDKPHNIQNDLSILPLARFKENNEQQYQCLSRINKISH